MRPPSNGKSQKSPDHFRCQYDAQGHAAMRDEGLLRFLVADRELQLYQG